MSIYSDDSGPEEIPPRGHVREVTREWLLRTDEELAHRLQDEEISNHLIGNRHRNEQIREDIPTAVAVQRETEEKARRKAQQLKRQADEDAEVARELSALQKLDINTSHGPHTSKEAKPSISLSNPRSSYIDPNLSVQRFSAKQEVTKSNGATPKRHTDSEVKMSKSRIHREVRDVLGASCSSVSHFSNIPQVGVEYHPQESAKYLDELEAALGVSKEQLHREQTRLLQEEKDAELARLIGRNENDELVEIRDEELARLLQNREYERFRKNKEKQKVRAMQKQLAKMNAAETRKSELPELNDTYCQPFDVIKGNQLKTEMKPEYLELDPGLNNHQEDPYYMEPFQGQGKFTEMASTSTSTKSNSLHQESKPLRAPPAPPRHSGRPMLAEPDQSDVFSGSFYDSIKNQKNGGKNTNAEQPQNSEGSTKRQGKKGSANAETRQKGNHGCRQM